jgi:glycosyltransferase involved in cell wall biosynthesis
MKSLVVAYSEMNGNGGGIFATLAYVNAMAVLAEETGFMFPSRDGAPDPRIHPAVRQIPVPDRASRIGKAARLLFKGIPHRFETKFPELISQERFDLVTFHNSKASRGLIDRAHARGAKVITVHNNYERDYTVDNEKPYYLPLSLPAILKSERESVRKSDLNLVLCEKDRELLRRHYDPQGRTRMEILGVFEYAHREFPVREEVAAPVFVMTGNLSTRQAEESLIPWMKDYHPVLLESVPDAKLILAGKRPGSKLKALAAERDIEVIDTPADMDAVLARGRYYICPTCKGGGVKLRVMDGLRAGLPVLTHEISARGYEPFLGITLFPYHDPASFRDSLDRMLALHPNVKEALQIYSDRFSFEAGTARLGELLRTL